MGDVVRLDRQDQDATASTTGRAPTRSGAPPPPTACRSTRSPRSGCSTRTSTWERGREVHAAVTEGAELACRIAAHVMAGELRLTRGALLRAAGIGGLALVVPGFASAPQARAAPAAGPRAANILVDWNAALLQAVRESKLGPPMVARALAIAHTCVYDAWAAYDRTAVGTRYGGALRRPARERRFDNKVEAISHAASAPRSICSRAAGPASSIR